MSGKIFEFTNTFGLANGLKLYFNRKYKKLSVIKVPFLKYPVHLRGQYTKSDIIMFKQIFCYKEYNISVPTQPQTIIDLGANVGFGSVYFADRFPTSRIFALEPNEENYIVACRNLEQYTNVKLVNGAIWKASEEIHMVDKGYGEASYMVEAGLSVNSMKACTIKQVMEIMNAEIIDILKIDIEGAEKEIFETGYEEWLPFTKIIIVEIHDRYKKGSSKAVFSAMSKFDFSLELSGENLVFYNNNLINLY